MAETLKIAVGDWVMFAHDSRPVIGLVVHVLDRQAGHRFQEVLTTAGYTTTSLIVERRPTPSEPEGGEAERERLREAAEAIRDAQGEGDIQEARDLARAALTPEPPAFTVDGDTITCHKAGAYEVNPQPPEEPCEMCGGSGQTDDEYGPCPRCSKEADHA